MPNTDVLLAILIAVLLLAVRWPQTPRRVFRRRRHVPKPPALASSNRHGQRKPDWVRHVVLALHARTGQSHRQLASTFNRLYFARTGVSVGRTWVRDRLKEDALAALHKRQQLKHRIPDPVPRNRVWGLDTTGLRDATQAQRTLLGLIDHGSRLALCLRELPRFNRWTLLGGLFLAIGRFGKPDAIRLDNHPVHRANLIKTVLHWAGIRLQFTKPASPWQNGRVERFFGTFKERIAGLVIADTADLRRRLVEFCDWYNTVRPHQHLDGRTPDEAWRGIDPYRRPPRRVLWYEAWGGRLCGWRLQH